MVGRARSAKTKVPIEREKPLLKSFINGNMIQLVNDSGRRRLAMTTSTPVAVTAFLLMGYTLEYAAEPCKAS